MSDVISIVPPVDKEKLKRLLLGEMYISESKDFEKEISDRIFYFLELACQKVNVDLQWFDYDNGDSGSETDGYFDYERYKKTIGIEGQFDSKKGHHSDDMMLIEHYFMDGLPIEVLFCDAEEKINEDLKLLHEYLKKEKEESERKAQEEEDKKKAFVLMVEQIKEKLTPEELSYVHFVLPTKSKKEKRKKK